MRAFFITVILNKQSAVLYRFSFMVEGKTYFCLRWSRTFGLLPVRCLFPPLLFDL